MDHNDQKIVVYVANGSLGKKLYGILIGLWNHYQENARDHSIIDLMDALNLSSEAYKIKDNT